MVFAVRFPEEVYGSGRYELPLCALDVGKSRLKPEHWDAALNEQKDLAPKTMLVLECSQRSTRSERKHHDTQKARALSF
jgi:hypothetical protein